MIIGAHIMVQSTNDAADQEFLTKVLKLGPSIWVVAFSSLAYRLRKSPYTDRDKNGVHELYFMCEDIEDFVLNDAQGIAYTRPRTSGWGTMTQITLPGGGKLGVYQPHHKRPKHVVPKGLRRRNGKKAVKAAARKASKKTVKKAKKRSKKR